MAGGEVMYMAAGRCGRQPRTDAGCAYWTPGFGCDRHTGTSCMQVVSTLRLVLSKGANVKLQHLRHRHLHHASVLVPEEQT